MKTLLKTEGRPSKTVLVFLQASTAGKTITAFAHLKGDQDYMENYDMLVNVKKGAMGDWDSVDWDGGLFGLPWAKEPTEDLLKSVASHVLKEAKAMIGDMSPEDVKGLRESATAFAERAMTECFRVHVHRMAELMAGALPRKKGRKRAASSVVRETLA